MHLCCKYFVNTVLIQCILLIICFLQNAFFYPLNIEADKILNVHPLVE